MLSASLNKTFPSFLQHVLVGGARVYRSGLLATNGVVHEMGGVMIPPSGNVMDVINNDPELSTLKQMVQTAGLTTFLQGKRPRVFFVLLFVQKSL